MKKILSWTAAVISVLLLTQTGIAAESSEDWVARIVSIQGKVEIRRVGAPEWTIAQLEDRLFAGDVIRVMERSRAAIVLPNDAVVRLDEQTTVSLTPPEKEASYLLKLVKGAVHFFSRVPRSLRILTPFVNGTIEGTEVVLTASETGSEVSILEGKFRIENEQGSLLLASGDSAVIRPGEPPRTDPGVVPLDRIQWALYYPPVLGLQKAAFDDVSDTDLAERLTRAAAAFAEGNTAAAFSMLDIDDRAVVDSEFFTLRASLLLFVGRVEEATADIQKLRQLDPGSGDADALGAIIAATRNRKDESLDLAESAVSRDPESASARIALSFAQQAGFDIEGAHESLLKAVELEPENGLAWARLAEIQLSLGEVKDADASASRAARLLPNLSRVQVVRGFTQLTRIRIDDALATFNTAVEQNSAAPLPRLGLGLAQIRKGDLKNGRQNIEIAAAMDPANSLLRSYLGKAYFEEKRDDDANHQFEMAKSLDPHDPTPYFYDAIRKQTENRPVEALEDIQQAIELNDNRAVYRSRFLLDQDLAARSAALGRIYRDLGFEQLALVEGYKSVNAAPSNYSAHRFLADVYSSKPRHEIARVSELLQSQLLQPLNVTPIQPQLAISNLEIIQGSGPSDFSFNEYNPLFLRNRLTLQASGVVGENDTWADEVVHAGLWNNISWSFGQFHYETDGFRENNDQKQDIYNGFLQFALDHNTQLQAELRVRDIERGDLEILFDLNDFNENEREDRDSETFRLGLHHKFSPGSDLILSFITEESDSDFEDEGVNLGTNFETNVRSNIDESRSAEAQYIYEGQMLKFVTGAGYVSRPRDRDTDTIVALAPGIDVTSLRDDTIDFEAFNLYTYFQLSLLKNLTMTLGVSADSVKQDRERFAEDAITGLPPSSSPDEKISREEQINPKFGIIWNPISSTTVRLATFRSLTRPLLAQQTIEPTQVAGFTQFFDDFFGSDTWVAGAAIDHRFSNTLFSGIEYYYRWLDVPFEDIAGSEIQTDEDDWRERVGRAYLYWNPLPMFSTRAEYIYEKFDDRDDLQDDERFIELETHRVKLGGGFFHPSGLFARVQTTYVDQEGEFADPFTRLSIGEDDDRFWVVDAAFGYRLPKRYGIISVEALNLFDESFNFQDTDPANPTIAPERWILFKLTLNF